MTGKPHTNETRAILRKFAQHPLDEPFIITDIRGGYKEADRVLGRLRTSLSRAKEKVRRQGLTPVGWSLVLIEITSFTKRDDNGTPIEFTKLIIKRTMDPVQKAVETDVDDLLSVLTRKKEAAT